MCFLDIFFKIFINNDFIEIKKKNEYIGIVIIYFRINSIF